VKPVIVIAAYSRANSLNRLLSSIENANYPSNDIKLIISLDGGASAEVLDVAKRFKFSNGNVEVVTREKNIGLKNHILWCGDQSLLHGTVIVLEDDLYVDPYFYMYSEAALEFYKGDEVVAGVALYSQRYNEYARLPFEPLFNGYSNYFMQVACSWGQAWTARQWSAFKNWYEKTTPNDIDNCVRLPDTVKHWPDSSWKKYFSAYIAYTNKYFVYPYLSYSTNCSDAGGVHLNKVFNYFQVPMAAGIRTPDEFKFCFPDQSSVKYDAFMEPINPTWLEFMNIQSYGIEFDFYGLKSIALLKEKVWCVTSKKCIKQELKISLRYKPVEMNLLNCDDQEGSSIVSLCRSVNVIKDSFLTKTQRHYKLAEYYSGFALDSRRLLIGILFNLPKKIRRILS
jgi:Glycosyl transferase family 2